MEEQCRPSAEGCSAKHHPTKVTVVRIVGSDDVESDPTGDGGGAINGHWNGSRKLTFNNAAER
jgi:hypothetical protein